MQVISSKLTSVLSLLTFVCLAGCGIAGNGMKLEKVPITGNQFAYVIITPDGPTRAQTEEVYVEVAGYAVNAQTKELRYNFTLFVKNGGTLKDIKVEDVTDETSTLLAEDSNPQLVKGAWKATSAPQTAASNLTNWVYKSGNTIRVYKFTMTLGTGKAVTVYQGEPIPVEAKYKIRDGLGPKK